MGFMNKGRVNFVITNHVLRYTYHKNTTSNGLAAHGEVELPENTIKDGEIVNKPVLLEVVNQLVHEQKWKRKKLYFAVPDDTVVIRQVEIPASLTREETIGYVNTQIGNSIHLPFAKPAIAIEYLEADEENQHILLFAYPKDKITAFQETFEKAGLQPIAADLTSLSVYRHYYMHESEPKDHVLLIQWNRDALVVTAFHEHKAIFMRYMKIEAGTDLYKEHAMQLINEYIIEINRTVDFYQYSITKGEARINQLLLSGDFPFLSNVQLALSEAVDIPIYDFKDRELAVKYTDVLGLAMKKDA